MLVDMTGCFLTSEPATGTTGGTIGLECSNLVGTDDNDDVYITYTSYIDDVMDPFVCEDDLNKSGDRDLRPLNRWYWNTGGWRTFHPRIGGQ